MEVETTIRLEGVGPPTDKLGGLAGQAFECPINPKDNCFLIRSPLLGTSFSELAR